MGYKKDLEKIKAALRDPNSRCYDPFFGKPLINTQERKLVNQRKLRRKRAVMRWRRLNSVKYRAYMREYMAKRRADKAMAAAAAKVMETSLVALSVKL